VGRVDPLPAACCPLPALVPLDAAASRAWSSGARHSSLRHSESLGGI
jgi:hypothetical protein